jgi:chitodextrinase
MSILFTRRRFFEATRTPAPAVLGHGGRFPAVASSDSIAPSVPTGLAGVAQSPNQINLSWNASTDSGSGVAGYRLYRGSTIAPIVDQAGRTFSDTGLTASTQYAYRVSAYDNSGNESAQSAAIQVTTQSSGGQTINVSSVAELVSAVSVANNSSSPTVIALADGTYQLSSFLNISADNVTIKSQSGTRANVIIRGDAISSNASVLFILRIEGDSFLAQDLTIGGRCRYSAIQIVGEAGASNGTIRNCIVQDSYEHLLKSSTDEVTGASGWIVEDCLFRFTAGIAPAQYNGGIDVHLGTNWIVRRCLFQDIASPATSACQHAISFWNGSTGCLIERNKIIDCDRGIGDGLSGHTANNGNTIRNNMVYHSFNEHQFADISVIVENATNSSVYHNTIFIEHAYPNDIEYRFTTTGAVIRNNLTNKPIRSRDGGTATVSDNVTSSTSGYFVSFAAGDLRLSTAIAGVVDAGATIESVTTDYEGTSRPQGPAYDIGADEYVSALQPTGLPLVQLSHISYLGFFNLPQQAGGSGDAFSMNYGGTGLAIGPGNTLYVGGHLIQQKLARFNIPAIGATASVVTNLTSIPGSYSNAEQCIGGALAWNSRVIVSKFGKYENSGGFINSHTSCSLSLTGFTSPQQTSFQREAAGFMGVIPPEWRALFGTSCFMGSGPRSIDNNQCSLGPAFFTFDPDTVDGSGSIPAARCLGYPLSQLQRIWPGHDFFETNGVVGAAFVPGTRSILFWGHAGAGNPLYKQPITGDPCRNGNSGFSDYPYHLCIWAYDANDLLAVKNGTKQSWEPLPYSSGASYTSWQTPGYGTAACSSCGLFNTTSMTFDPSTMRVYMCEDYGEQPRVHVWQIAAP